MLKTYEVLEKALALIEDERNWTTGNDGMFEWCWRPGEKADRRLCAEGSLGCVLGLRGLAYDDIAGTDAYKALQGQLPDDWRVWEVNDEKGHAAVVALFQKAIRAEKAKEGIPAESFEKVEVRAEVPA